MKNLLSETLKIAGVCTLLCLTAQWTPGISAEFFTAQHKTHVDFSAANYSWSAHASAASYQAILTPRGAGSPINFNTTGTSISLAGVPSGVYDVTVTAIFAKGNSTIIIEDIIQT